MDIGVVSVTGWVVAAANSVALDVDAIRISLHLLAMAVWIGGQILMMLAGAATFLHQRAATASLRGASAGIGFVASLIVVIMGAILAH